MTISDFLKLPNFTDLRLLAGKYGLLSEVTNVTVVDTPDGTNWLNGGSLRHICFMRKRTFWSFFAL